MVRLLLRILCVLLIANCTAHLLAAENPSEQVEASVAPPSAGDANDSARKIRKDLQLLVDKGVEALAPELVKSHTFYPFAAILGHDNEVRLVGVTAAERSVDPEQALAALVKKIRQLAAQKRIRAAAYFMDYEAHRQDNGIGQPGIRIELNHRQPDAMSAFIPYSITSQQTLRLLTPQYKPGKNLTFEFRDHGKP